MSVILAEHLFPLSGPYHWQIITHVLLTGVDVDVALRRTTKHLDYLNQLLLRTIPRKDRLEGQEFHQNAPARPYINLSTIVSGAHHQFRCPVVPRTYVGHVAFLLFENFGRPIVT